MPVLEEFVVASVVFENFEESRVVRGHVEIAIDDDFELAFAVAVAVACDYHRNSVL